MGNNYLTKIYFNLSTIIIITLLLLFCVIDIYCPIILKYWFACQLSGISNMYTIIVFN